MLYEDPNAQDAAPSAGAIVVQFARRRPSPGVPAHTARLIARCQERLEHSLVALKTGHWVLTEAQQRVDHSQANRATAHR